MPRLGLLGSWKSRFPSRRLLFVTRYGDVADRARAPTPGLEVVVGGAEIATPEDGIDLISVPSGLDRRLRSFLKQSGVPERVAVRGRRVGAIQVTHEFCATMRNGVDLCEFPQREVVLGALPEGAAAWRDRLGARDRLLLRGGRTGRAGEGPSCLGPGKRDARRWRT